MKSAFCGWMVVKIGIVLSIRIATMKRTIIDSVRVYYDPVLAAPAAASSRQKRPRRACHAEEPAAAEPTKRRTPPEAKFKLVCWPPGPVNDGGWNQVADEALKRMENRLGAEIGL